MSVSTVYEDPQRSPKWCVTTRTEKHVATHRFWTPDEAESFRDRAVAAPDRLDYALAVANAFLEGDTIDQRYPTAVHALAELTAAVEVDRMQEGRR